MLLSRPFVSLTQGAKLAKGYWFLLSVYSATSAVEICLFFFVQRFSQSAIRNSQSAIASVAFFPPSINYLTRLSLSPITVSRLPTPDCRLPTVFSPFTGLP